MLWTSLGYTSSSIRARTRSSTRSCSGDGLKSTRLLLPLILSLSKGRKTPGASQRSLGGPTLNAEKRSSLRGGRHADCIGSSTRWQRLGAGSGRCSPARSRLQPSQPRRRSEKPDTTGITDSEIVIGMWLPLSGNAASLYAPIGKAHEAYFKMLNEQGGTRSQRSSTSRKMTSYDPTKTVPLVKKMVEEDKVFGSWVVSARPMAWRCSTT